jgi:hypothetical protein
MDVATSSSGPPYVLVHSITGEPELASRGTVNVHAERVEMLRIEIMIMAEI